MTNDASNSDKSVSSEPISSGQSKQKKSRLRFGLRSMLILLAISAFGANYVRNAWLQRDAVARLQQSQSKVVYQFETDSSFDLDQYPWQNQLQGSDNFVTNWIRNSWGSHYVDSVSHVCMIEVLDGMARPIDESAWKALRTLDYLNELEGIAIEVETAEQLESILQFEHLKQLELISYLRNQSPNVAKLGASVETLHLATKTPDVDWIAELKGLQRLKIRKTLGAPKLTFDIRFLKTMTELKSLEIHAADIEGMEVLQNLKLDQLTLSYTGDTFLSEEGISIIAKMPNLESLYLLGDQVANEAIDNARRRLPGVKVNVE